MSIEQLRSTLPDYAKDIRLNLSNLLGTIPQSGLNEGQFYGTSLAIAFALKDKALIKALAEDGATYLSPEVWEAAKSAATLMAMNNIYYRAVHLSEDNDLKAMPANLRMNAMLNPGVSKIDFELFSLAVSVINGCGLCIQSHVKHLVHHGVEKQAIQSTFRLAACLNALVEGLFIAQELE